MMNEQLYRLVEDDPEFGEYRKAVENRDGTLPEGVLVWWGLGDHLNGFLVPVEPDYEAAMRTYRHTHSTRRNQVHAAVDAAYGIGGDDG